MGTAHPEIQTPAYYKLSSYFPATYQRCMTSIESLDWFNLLLLAVTVEKAGMFTGSA